MENANSLKTTYPYCQLTDPPTLFSRTAEEEMNFFCNGIQQGREPDGRLLKGEQVAIHSEEDPVRPWIITREGVIAQVEGRLRAMPL